MTDGWIEHDGKGMPVGGETRVQVRYEDGIESSELPARFCHSKQKRFDDWSRSKGSRHIIAYRVVKP